MASGIDRFADVAGCTARCVHCSCWNALHGFNDLKNTGESEMKRWEDCVTYDVSDFLCFLHGHIFGVNCSAENGIRSIFSSVLRITG